MSGINRKTPQKERLHALTFRQYMGRYWQFYAMMLVPICYFLLFKYVPILGNILAFRRFKPLTGPYGVSWAEPPLRYFEQFLKQERSSFGGRFGIRSSSASRTSSSTFPFPSSSPYCSMN